MTKDDLMPLMLSDIGPTTCTGCQVATKLSMLLMLVGRCNMQEHVNKYEVKPILTKQTITRIMAAIAQQVAKLCVHILQNHYVWA